LLKPRLQDRKRVPEKFWKTYFFFTCISNEFV
jgi:hypothetical protein